MANETTAATVVDAKIAELAKAYKGSLKLENGIAVTDEKNLFEKNLGDGESLSAIKEAQNILKRHTAAYSLAVSELGLDAMKKDKKLEQVSGELKMGYDNAGCVFKRVNHGRNPSNGETTTTYGHLRPYYTASAGANKGDLAKVRKHMSERAAAILK